MMMSMVGTRAQYIPFYNTVSYTMCCYTRECTEVVVVVFFTRLVHAGYLHFSSFSLALSLFLLHTHTQLELYISFSNVYYYCIGELYMIALINYI